MLNSIQSRHWIALLLIVLNGPFILAQVEVSGTVYDADDIPVIGANVLEEGTSNGTITDFDGKFSLSVSNADAILEISYIGYETQTVRLNGNEPLTIVLQESSELLDEVVVVGYGNQKKSDISGSVSVVTAEEIKSTPALRLEQAMQGRTAGVQISQNSGSPGSELTVRIRGIGTVNNSNPLYVVDGVILENLDFLNTNDVASISILKDAAASAVYGARAANGVVLITTKSGTKNKIGSVSYDAYYGNQSVANTLDLLNAREYAVISNEAYINSGLAPIQNLSNPAQFNQGTNWQEAIFSNAPVSSHNININHSTEDYNAGISASVFNQEGIVGGDKSAFKRYTARAVVDINPKPWLKVGTNLGFSNNVKNIIPENNEFVSPITYALNMDPLTPVVKPDGTYAYSDFVDTDIRNPVNAIATQNDIYKTNRLVGSASGEVKFTDFLKFKSTYSLDIAFGKRRGFIPLYNLSVDSIDAPVQEINRVNSVSIEQNIWRTWQWENLAFFNKQVGPHSYGAAAGISANAYRGEFSGGANTDLPTNIIDDALLSNTIGSIASQSAYEWAEEYTFFSYISKFDYTYDSKYLLTASFRADGSSKFGKNKRFGYFPALSVGWNLHEEDFFNIGAIDILKLRASWGRNGNDRIGNYGFSSVVLAGQNYTFGPDEAITNGAIALRVSNPDLQWETVEQTNFGIDAEFWKGRVVANIDYYIKKTSDMLYEAPIPGIVGALAPVRNVGDVDNRGLELALQYKGSAGAMNYNIGGNISFIENKVTNLGGGDPNFSGETFVQGFVSRTDVGQPIASFYGFVTDGIFQTQSEVEEHAFQNAGTSAGDIRFVDLNEDGVIDENDKTYIGNPTPDALYGANLGLDYKNFDLSAYIQGVYGNEIFNASVRYDKIGANRPASILERWTGEGTSDSEPRVGITDPNNNARVSDRFIEDGSFLRLKNVQVGYTFPRTLLNRINVQKLRIYVSGQNLLTFTNYSGYDPEIGTRGPLEIGIDRGFYPTSRMVLGGINLTF